MKDEGVAYSDKELASIERRLKTIYGQAENDISAKMESFEQKYAQKDALYREKVRKGEMTKDEYDYWKRGQVFQGNLWQQKKDQIADTLYNANVNASNLINDRTIKVFTENANYASYAMEHGVGVNFGFTLYDENTVSNLIKNEPNLLVQYTPKKGIDKAWNKRKITNQVTQGIIQGESIPDIAKRLSKVTGSQNMNSMKMHARTSVTNAQNAGRIQSYKDAQSLGIDVKKEWLATLDGRTRDQHGRLDGQKVDVDKPFVIDGFAIQYPGDPTAEPALVYNCRCTLVVDIVDYPSQYKGYTDVDGKFVGAMSYDEWKNGKNMKTARGIVNGKDLSNSFARRKGEYEFEIEDVINAQGFDGLPRVVSPEEFDDAVKESSFVAQRTYSAPDQETLDAYRDQLYNGKWYVDCATGGSQYGQGMYCAADYTGKLSDGIKSEMEHYRTLGNSRLDSIVKENAEQKVWNDALANATKKEKSLIKREYLRNATDEEMALARRWEKENADDYLKAVNKYGKTAKNARNAYENAKAMSYTETMTLDPSARIISYRELDELRSFGNIERHLVEGLNLNEDKKTALLSWIDEEAEIDELPSDLREYGSWLDSRADKLMKMDKGSFAAVFGYDAINAGGHGESGSYTVILNRTKLIIKGE